MSCEKWDGYRSDYKCRGDELLDENLALAEALRRMLNEDTPPTKHETCAWDRCPICCAKKLLAAHDARRGK